jgi:hypothetical protein
MFIGERFIFGEGLCFIFKPTSINKIAFVHGNRLPGTLGTRPCTAAAEIQY